MPRRIQESKSENTPQFSIAEIFENSKNFAKLSLSQFEIEILDCFYSLLLNGQDTFSIEEIVKAMKKRGVALPKENGYTYYVKKLTKKQYPELSEDDLKYYDTLHQSIKKLYPIVLRIKGSELKNSEPGEANHTRHIFLLPLTIMEYNTASDGVHHIEYNMLSDSFLCQYVLKLKTSEVSHNGT